METYRLAGQTGTRRPDPHLPSPGRLGGTPIPCLGLTAGVDQTNVTSG